MGASTGSKFTRSTNLAIPASNKVCIRVVGEILHNQAERQFAFSNHTLNAGNPEITMSVRLNGTSTPNKWAFLYGTTGAYYHWYTSKDVKAGKSRCIITLYDYASPATCRFLYLASDNTWMDETVSEQFGLTPSGPAAMSHPAVIGSTNDDLYPWLGDLNEVTVWDSHPSTSHLQAMIGQTDGTCRSPGRYSSRSNIITHVPLFTSATLTDDADGSTWTKSGSGTTVTDYAPAEMSGRSLLQPADGVGHDAIFRTGSPTTNAGAGTTGAVGHNSTGTVLFVRVWNQFAKDSRLAAGDTILYGTRTLECTIASSGIHNIVTKGCTRASLDEAQVCHNYYTGTTPWTLAGGDMGMASVVSALPAATGAFVEDVTTILQERFDAGNATFGFISYRQNESSADADRATFALSENATEGSRPKLDFWFGRVGGAEPVTGPDLTLGGAASCACSSR